MIGSDRRIINAKGNVLKGGKTSHPDAVADICHRLAIGDKQKHIAESYDVTPTRISTMSALFKERIKEIRERIIARRTDELLEPAFKIIKKEIAIDEKITDSIAEKVESNTEVPKHQLEVKKAVGNAKTEVLREEGVFSKGINTQINLNKTDNKQTIISDNVMKFLVKGDLFEPMEEINNDNNI